MAIIQFMVYTDFDIRDYKLNMDSSLNRNTFFMSIFITNLQTWTSKNASDENQFLYDNNKIFGNF